MQAEDFVLDLGERPNAIAEVYHCSPPPTRVVSFGSNPGCARWRSSAGISIPFHVECWKESFLEPVLPFSTSTFQLTSEIFSGGST